jgi:beta-glucosidase
MNTKTSSALDAFGDLTSSETLTDEQIEGKAQSFLEQLTFEEKLGMMDGDEAFWSGMADMFSGGYNAHVWVAGAVPRLGLPGIRFSDGPRGVVMAGATTFPVPMARGATWDSAMEERVGDVIGRELRAMGGNFFGGVCINLLRHPAWGRAQETYGEDSYHLGIFGAAVTQGVQQHVMACVKHFALNSMENARFTVDATIDPRALHEVYLSHFKRVIDSGVASVMSAYNSVNGEWCGQNHVLLTDILKEQWGFRGFVMTDFIFGMRDAQKAALAGQDIEMPFQMHFHAHLKQLVEQGSVPIERINDAVLRIVREQVRFAQGRDSADYDPGVIGSQEHRALAREVAEKSIVLLKNEGQVLPLRQIKHLAVIGKLADTPNTGDGGSSNTQPAYVVTPLQGLREALGEEVEIEYDDGSDPEKAVVLARRADAVVLVAGYTAKDEGEFITPEGMTELAKGFPVPTAEEQPNAQAVQQSLLGDEATIEGFAPGGDRAYLTLHPEDEALIQAVAAVNQRTIVTMMGGSAIITEAWRAQVPAILMLWYPGMEGGHALADILLGKVNPSGKLPCTFPADDTQLPYFDRNATRITYDLWHGYRKLERDGTVPAFPFGFGLSYTTYIYGDIHLAQTTLHTSETLRATLTITNSGAMAGEEVVQLYIGTQDSKIERAPRELKAFTRVALAVGETRKVSIEVPVSELAYYDRTAGWSVEPITYEVIIGRHALDSEARRAQFTVEA